MKISNLRRFKNMNMTERHSSNDLINKIKNINIKYIKTIDTNIKCNKTMKTIKILNTIKTIEKINKIKQ